MSESIDGILSLLRDRARVDLTRYKESTMLRRVKRQMMLHKVQHLSEYEAFLKKNPEALKELHDEIFIHVTEFFRDPESYEALVKQVFPRLLDKRGKEPLRVWITACSTGEEAYSIAMLLTEYLEALSKKVPLQIFATDISEAAIVKARKGIYNKAQLKGVPKKRVQRFFTETSEGLKVKKEIRDLCVFSRHDLISDPPFARIDLLTCRNLLIYFERELQNQVMQIFSYALNPESVLWLGQSESAGTISKLFTVLDKKNRIYLLERKAPVKKQTYKQHSVPLPGLVPFPKAEEFRKSVDEVLLTRYAPPGVVINGSMEILQFHGRTAPFLEPASGSPTHLLLKMAHPDLIGVLRVLVQKAKKINKLVRKNDVPFAGRTISIEIHSLRPLSPEREREFLVVFDEARPVKEEILTTTKKTRKKIPPKDLQVNELLGELEQQREYQQTVIEQYESAQEELTSANEELQATNEELQSTNEELETAKEELQAANEELVSMNTELQERNAELNLLNEKLARSEERFRLIVEGVRDYAIFMLDPNGRVASWNEGARRFKGYESSEIMGHYFGEFYPEEDKLRHKPEWELETARTHGRVEDEGWRVRKDGTRFWANVIITRMNDGQGNLIGFSKVTRDLTDKRQSEEILRQSEQRFRTMVSAVKDYAIFMLDPEGHIASWNEGAKRIKGFDATDVIGKHFSLFYLQEDIDRHHPEEELSIARELGKYEEEGLRKRKDGTTFWAHVVISRMTAEDGTLLGFTKVTRDLTERKRAEELLKEANLGLEKKVRERTKDLEAALRVRDEFLSIASHELKTPLTSLKLQLQMKRKKIDVEKGIAPSPKDMAYAFDVGIRQANNLGSLIEDLLEVSRIQTGWFSLNLEEFALADLIREIHVRFSEQIAAAGSTPEVELEEGLVGFWDKRRLEQVIVNLISNALKYAPGTKLRLEARRKDDRAILKVQDFGAGIPKELQQKIFERFERVNVDRSIGGLGLGLFIARRIIEAHKGNITVESEIDRGTTFIVELPLS